MSKSNGSKGSNGSRDAKQHPTPMLDELEDGPWPSFVTGLKRLRDSKGKQYAPMMNDLLGQLEHSYEERLGFWKGGLFPFTGMAAALSRGFPKSLINFPNRRNSTPCA